MHELKKLFLERVSSGLKRHSLTTPSRWAQEYRVMSKPFAGKWTFNHHPWLKEMHDSKAELNIGQKGAQLGFTETMLNIVFFRIDVESVDCLYVLPAKTPDASDFSASRFDPAVELSAHLNSLFSDVKNIGHKRAGTTNLYIRGSKSRAGLKSIPVGQIILDEVDEFNEDNIPLALERASGQKEKQVWMISTPSIHSRGINKYFQESTQEEYFFKCPFCSVLTNLTFPDCLEITGETFDDYRLSDSFIKCNECKTKLEHKEKPDWLANGIMVPKYKNRDSRGFYISQLYSSTVSPYELAKAYLKSLNDPADEQIFYNDKLGIPHMVKGARLTDHQIDSCKGEYLNSCPTNNPIITMGIDVGKWLHYEVDSWKIPSYQNTIDLNVESKPRVLEEGKVLHFEELDNIMRRYRVMGAVIDANPERRKAYEFASRFYGHVKMCFYGRGIYGKQIKENDSVEPTITVDRTSWLDLSLGRFRNNSITIPSNTSREYTDHLKALVRMYEKDQDGNPVGRYIKASGDDDHFAHARNYSEIALVFALGMNSPQSIKSPI